MPKDHLDFVEFGTYSLVAFNLAAQEMAGPKGNFNMTRKCNVSS